jgi:hypothetical protein
MRWLPFLLLGLISFLPLSGDTAIDPNRSYTLISVSHPGMDVSEVHSLCGVAAPGVVAPLHLKIVEGNANPKCISLESATDAGYFLRHQNSQLKLHPFPENDQLFAYDSTFYLIQNPDGTVSFRSYNYPKQYISVTASNELYIATDPEVPSRSFTLGN